MATQAKLRTLLISLSFLLFSCGTPGTVKVYFLDPAKGFVRNQKKEVLPFDKTKGYLCETPEDFNDTVSCVGGAVKVYSSQPAMSGLYRKQANELILYVEARGFLCVSPPDMKQILDNCKTNK